MTHGARRIVIRNERRQVVQTFAPEAGDTIEITTATHRPPELLVLLEAAKSTARYLRSINHLEAAYRLEEAIEKARTT